MCVFEHWQSISKFPYYCKISMIRFAECTLHMKTSINVNMVSKRNIVVFQHSNEIHYFNL